MIAGAAIAAVAALPALFAAPAQAAVAAPAAVSAPSVASLTTTGARTDVQVANLKRTRQAKWVDSVVDDRLASIDGCIANPTQYTFRGGVYASKVYTLCSGGVAKARSAAARLTAQKPWYKVKVTSVKVVAFTMQADVGGSDSLPADAAMKHLPNNASTYVEGDDTSMLYVGRGVTSSQLSAARAAFAKDLGVSVAKVSITPVRF